MRKSLARCDLVLTSYTLSHLDEVELGAIAWNSICLDEAQNIKNAYTKQAIGYSPTRWLSPHSVDGNTD